MVVLLDARLGRRLTGIGNYVMELARQFGRDSPEVVRPMCTLRHARRFRSLGLCPLVVRAKRLPATLPPADVIHGPNFHPPPHPTARRVATIHDLGYVLLPECHPPGMPERLDALVRASLPHTALFICNSVSTRNAFVDVYGVPESACRVAPMGVDTTVFRPHGPEGEGARMRRRYGLRRPFLLFVGAMVPRKDLLTLVETFRMVREQWPKLDLQLVLAGSKTLRWASDWPRVSEWMRQHPDVAPCVRVLNYLPAADLPALYREAELMILTSLLEGFGLPVLEAFACGTPAVITRSGALPEVGGTAAYYGDVRSPESLAAAVACALDGDDADRRREEAARIVRAHPWRRTAAVTMDAYRAVVSGH
jgi:glycosyltransferase involved in cell wall biosynthesis